MKLIAIGVIAISFFFVSHSSLSAQILVINEKGETILNVLSEETVNLEVPNRQLEIKDVLDNKPTSNAHVTLKREDNKISMTFDIENENKELDVTDWKNTLIEVEERPEVHKMRIALEEGKFTIFQRGITAITDFPLTIDSKSAKISVTTGSGDRYIAVLPYQAVESTLRAKILNNVSYSERLLLTEEEQELIYIIKGDKQLTFFKLYTHSFPVISRVSALDGTIINTDEPIWLKFLGYMFG